MNPLDTLRSLNSDTLAAAVLSPDGAIEAIAADTDLEDVIGPVMTTLIAMAERATRELGRGGLETAILQGNQGLVVARDLGAGRLLAVIAKPSAQLGLLLDDIRAASEQVALEVA